MMPKTQHTNPETPCYVSMHMPGDTATMTDLLLPMKNSDGKHCVKFCYFTRRSNNKFRHKLASDGILMHTSSCLY